MVVAIESNLFELYLAFGRMPGSRIEDRTDMLRVKTGLRHELMNGIFRGNIPEDAEEEAIRGAVEEFLSDGVPFLWWVGPSTRPAHLGKFLEHCGLVRAGDLSGMAIDLGALDVSPAIPRELSIEPVREEKALKAWVEPFAMSYGMSRATARSVYEFRRSFGFGPKVPFRHYLGRWRDEPVATSTLFFGAGVAGVYVTVVPEYRKRGIGSVMTLVPLRTARTAGYRVGVTHVPDFRIGSHRKIGFKPYCTLTTYTPRALVRGRRSRAPRRTALRS